MLSIDVVAMVVFKTVLLMLSLNGCCMVVAHPPGI